MQVVKCSQLLTLSDSSISPEWRPMNHHPQSSVSPSSQTSPSTGRATGWRRWGGLVLISAVAAPLLAACGGSTDETEITPVTTTVTVTSTLTTTERPDTTTVTSTVTAEPETTIAEPVEPPVDMDANVAPAAVAAIPEPTPAPVLAPAPAATYYQNCTAVRAAGAAPLYAGSPGYSSKLDRDGDGVACE